MRIRINVHNNEKIKFIYKCYDSSIIPFNAVLKEDRFATCMSLSVCIPM